MGTMPSQNIKVNSIKTQFLSHDADSLGFTQISHAGGFSRLGGTLCRFGRLLARGQAGAIMSLVRSLIERLKRWVTRYKATLDYANARDWRRPPHEIEWQNDRRLKTPVV
jgi:hypothetical protein